MSNLYDEKYWHEIQIRRLPWPSGQNRPVKMMRMGWGCFDALVEEHGLKPASIVEFCIEQAITKEQDFNTAFPHYLAHLEHNCKEKAKKIREINERKPWQPGDGPVSRVQIEAIQDEIDTLKAMRSGDEGWKPPE